MGWNFEKINETQHVYIILHEAPKGLVFLEYMLATSKAYTRNFVRKQLESKKRP